MKNDERIIDFFEGNLNEYEKEKLLEEIEKNPELKSEFENYGKLYSYLKKSNDIKPSETYLETIIPKFRSKTKKPYILFKPVFATALIIFFGVIGIIFYNIFLKNGSIQFDETNTYLEISSIQSEDLGYMASLFEKEELDELLFTELLGKENEMSKLENYFHLDNNYNILPETDAEEIYKELITKKIL